MHVLTQADTVAAFRAEARWQRGRAMSPRLGRLLVDAWQRYLERRIEHAVRRLDHAGVLADFQQASHG
jgi:hypothetical protein